MTMTAGEETALQNDLVAWFNQVHPNKAPSDVPMLEMPIGSFDPQVSFTIIMFPSFTQYIDGLLPHAYGIFTGKQTIVDGVVAMIADFKRWLSLED